MISINAYALGTYYTNNGVSSGPTDAWDLRCLVYWMKGKRPTSVVDVKHPWVPDARRISCQAEAVEFAADAFGAKYKKTPGVTLVPVPSSEVTEATLGNARWGSLAFANALAERGFGRVCIAAVNSHPTESGQTRDFSTIRGNLQIMDRPTGQILFVDDTVTHGGSLMAIADLIGVTAAYAFVVGATSSTQRASALLPVVRALQLGPGGTIQCSDSMI
jgi:hypothetical protein